MAGPWAVYCLRSSQAGGVFLVFDILALKGTRAVRLSTLHRLHFMEQSIFPSHRGLFFLVTANTISFQLIIS